MNMIGWLLIQVYFFLEKVIPLSNLAKISLFSFKTTPKRLLAFSSTKVLHASIEEM